MEHLALPAMIQRLTDADQLDDNRLNSCHDWGAPTAEHPSAHGEKEKGNMVALPLNASTIPLLTQAPTPSKPGEQVIEYPSDDGNPMAETACQAIPMVYTFGALHTKFKKRPDVYVAINMQIYYIEGNNSASVAPNVFVVCGANGNHPRKNWLVWEEGQSPDFVMEIAAEGKWERDAKEKRDIYASIGVQEYWRLDPSGEYFHKLGLPVLAGERLTPSGYERIGVTELADGLLGHSDVLGLALCIRGDGAFRFFDTESETWLMNQTEEQQGKLVAQESRFKADVEAERLMEQLSQLQESQYR